MKVICKSFFSVFAVLLFAAVSFGQEFRGTISGTIADPNGAPVPNATVAVRNIGTNITTTVTANGEGSYVVPLLQPGMYSITAKAEGFKTSIRENVEVRVDDRITADLKLEIGTTAEVNVIAEDEILERGNVTTGTVVTAREISELPLSEGAAYNLATQAPGVSYTGNPNFTGPTANGNLAAFRTNGVGGNQITLDGSPNSAIDGAVAYTPPADALSQFKIQTNAFDAQNGYTAGSTVNVAVKTGTNKLHGSAYYFDRSKALTANNFFSNRAGVDRPDRKYYRYGGQVNGPVRIPYIYNGKDKTFFMFSYEKQYNKRPEPEVFTVPTELMRTGNFSELLTLPTPVIIYDPATATLRNTTCVAGSTGTTVCRTPFANNIIPTARLNAAAQRFLNLYPKPNQTGLANGTVDNYFSNQTNVQPYDSYLARVDHNFNGSNRMFAKFFYSKSDEDRYNWLDTPGSVTQGFEIRRNIGGNLNYTSILSNNVVFDVRASYNNFLQERIAPNAVSAASLGFAGIAGLTTSPVFPRFDFTNYDTLGSERADFNEGLNREYQMLSVQPTLTQIWGNHTLKYGYDFRKIDEARLSNGYNAGRFLFTGTYTSQASNTSSAIINQTGREIAAFLLGIPNANAASLIEKASPYDVNTNYHGFFVQDDWRVTPKLSLNLGLRYELETGLRETEGRMVVGFDNAAASPLRSAVLANFDANIPASVPRTTFANLAGGLTFATDASQRNQATDKNNFQPRIGISYALRDKTVLRAGFGIFSAPFQIQPINQAGFTASTSFTSTTNNGLTFIADINNPFPSGLNPAVGSSLGLNTLLGTTIGTTNATGPTETTVHTFDRKNASYKRFVIGVQHELPYQVAIEANLVISRGSDLPVLRQLNYLPREVLNNFNGVDSATIASTITATTTFLNQTVANPFRGLVPQNATLNAATIQRRFLLTQYPQFQDLIVTEYNGTSKYGSLQLQASKRFGRGISVNASYTYSDEKENTRRLNPQDADLTEMISTFSRPHRFSLSSVFELPFGRKRAFLSNLHPVADAFLGGWQLNTVFERQSGEPLLLPNLYYAGDITQLRARIGQRNENGQRYGVDIPAFDISGFRVNGVVPGFSNNYTVSSQNALRLIPYTLDNFRNQSFQKFDLGLTKNFRISEQARLQVRVEGINALNWVYFSGIQLAATNAAFGFVNAQRNLPRDIQLGARFTF
jgi:Carboxypeptidase regulatory-like domain/TonB dependent receptor